MGAVIEPPPPRNRLTRHVVLVGPAGAGKSTIGRALALEMGAAFVDLDDEIELAERRGVDEIFATDGETAFRVLEVSHLDALLSEPTPLVVSTGGGTVVSPAARRRLRSDDVVVIGLSADPEVLAARISAVSRGRPLHAADPFEATCRLLAERRGWFEEVAERTVDTGRVPVAEVVSQLAGSVTGVP